MSVHGSIFSGTVISFTDFGDFLCARYNFPPLNFQSNFDEYGTDFGVTHTLSCSIDGLVIARHNKIYDKLLYLYQLAFSSAYVYAKPQINKVCTRSEQEIRQGSDKDEERWGDVMVPGLWDCQVNAIIDVKLGDADVDS